MNTLGTGNFSKIIVCVAIVFFAFVIGLVVGYKKAPTKIVYKDAEPKIETRTETKTEVQYVEKTSPDDADVEIDNSNPVVSIDGKKFEMQKLPTETNKFEDGKVTVKQGYEIKINAKDVIPKTPKWGMDIGYSNHGIKTGVEYNFNRNVSAYVEGTPVPTGDKDRYIGAGIRAKF